MLQGRDKGRRCICRRKQNEVQGLLIFLSFNVLHLRVTKEFNFSLVFNLSLVLVSWQKKTLSENNNIRMIVITRLL